MTQPAAPFPATSWPRVEAGQQRAVGVADRQVALVLAHDGGQHGLWQPQVVGVEAAQQRIGDSIR